MAKSKKLSIKIPNFKSNYCPVDHWSNIIGQCSYTCIQFHIGIEKSTLIEVKFCPRHERKEWCFTIGYGKVEDNACFKQIANFITVIYSNITWEEYVFILFTIEDISKSGS